MRSATDFRTGDLVETVPALGVVRGRVEGRKGHRVRVALLPKGTGEITVAPLDLVLVERGPEGLGEELFLPDGRRRPRKAPPRGGQR